MANKRASQGKRSMAAWGAIGTGCVLALAVAAGCSDEQSGDVDGAGGEAGVGGDTAPVGGGGSSAGTSFGGVPTAGVTAGGTAGTAGTTGIGGSAHGGEPALGAGAPNQAGGAAPGGASPGGAASGGATGDGGYAGELTGGAGAGAGAGSCVEGTTCLVPADCAEGTTCLGSSVQRVCVLEADFCDPETCTQRSAGCVDHRCLPALALGATCATSHQCASGFCDASGHVCAQRPSSCGCEDDSSCGDGASCIPVHDPDLDPCWPDFQRKCVLNPAPEGSECNPPLCGLGLVCAAEFGGTGVERCHAPAVPLGAICEPSSIYFEFQCALGLDCRPDPSGAYSTCQPLGEEGADCPCKSGFFCDTASKCRSLAARGQSCADKGCKEGLRCVDAAVDGACCSR